MSEKNNKLTAGELQARLQSNPDYLARKREKERVRDENEAKYAETEIPLLSALRDVGIQAKSVWDLVNSSNNYDQAIPVLLDHLCKQYPGKVREGIARSLAIPNARVGWSILVSEFKNIEGVSSDEKGVKDALAVAISATATEADTPTIIELVKDRRHGKSRVLLLIFLRNSRALEAKKTIEELRADPDLSVEIASWGNR